MLQQDNILQSSVTGQDGMGCFRPTEIHHNLEAVLVNAGIHINK